MSSAIGAYINVLTKDKVGIEKVVWTCWMLGMAAIAIHMSYSLCGAYFEHNTALSVSVTYDSPLLFPTVYVCSSNLINATFFDSKYPSKATESLENLLTDVTSGVQFNSSVYFGFEVKNDTMFEGRMKFGEMVVGSSYVLGGNRFSNLTTTANERGYCLTINKNGTFYQETSGPEGGLVITIDAKTQHYLTSTGSVGLTVLLTSPYETALKTGGYHVSTGTQTDIRLQSRTTEHLQAPHGNCTVSPSPFNASQSMSYTDCQLYQTIIAYREVCGCVPWYITQNSDPAISSVLSNTSECTFLMYWSCRRNVTDRVKGSPCATPCSSTKYSPTLTTTVFPSTLAHFAKYIKEWSGYANITQARDNLVRLKIYYPDLIHETEVHKETYKFESFLANLAAHLNLFLGLTMFTVIEMTQLVRGGVRRRRGPPPSPCSVSSDGMVARVARSFNIGTKE